MGMLGKGVISTIFVFILIINSTILTSTAKVNIKEQNLIKDFDEYFTANNTIYVDDDSPPGGDGSRQHPFQSIIEGINASEEGDIVYVFNGTYEEYLKFNKSIKLIGESKEKTILEGLSGMEVSNIKYLMVKGFYLNGSTGIYLFRTHKSDISDNILNYCDITLSNSSYNTIENNFIKKSRTRGIRLWAYSDNNTISGNTIYNEGIDIDTGNNKIIGNKIINGTIGASHYDNNVISNNVIENIKGNLGAHGIQILWCSNTIISNNIIRNLSADLGVTGIDIVYSENTTIIGNTISNLEYANSACGISISMDGSDSATITDNNITNIYGALSANGIVISSSSHHKVSGNYIFNVSSIKGFCDGISFDSSSNNEIIKNTIISCDYSCIFLVTSNNNIIKENILIGDWPDNLGFDICLGGFVTNSIISKNIITNNSRGLYISIGCRKNEVSKNKIKYNGEGITLGRGDNNFGGASYNLVSNNHIIGTTGFGVYCEKGSRNNKIFYNNFIDNGNEEFGGNAYDEGFNLWFWFKSFRIRGNYWDDLEAGQKLYKIPPKFFFNTDFFPLDEPVEIS